MKNLEILKMFGFEDEIESDFFDEFCMGKGKDAPSGEKYDEMLAEYRKVKEKEKNDN